MHNLEGRELGGCKLLRKLGAGGMGEVYLAEQRRVGNRLVAVKVVSPEDISFHPEVAEDMARRFKREIELLGNLSHPNILPIYDGGEEGSLLYIVMEYAQEGSLTDAIRGQAKQTLALPVPAPRAVEMIGEIAAALQYCHDHSVVHRDVKPGNVLIRIEPDGSWRMLLADFGVARGLDNTSQRTQVTGTFAYMAPEQFSGQFSPKSDQYALAVMAFQLLAGRLPFEGDLAALTRAHMYDPPPSLHAINPAVPQAVDAVFARALAKRPDDRYPSVAEFAAALKAASASTSDVADATTHVATPLPGAVLAATPPATSPAPALTSTDTQRVRRRMRPARVLVTLLAALVLLVGVLGGGELLHNQQQQQSAQDTRTAQTAQAGSSPIATSTSAGGAPTVSPGASPGSTVTACGTLAGSAGCVVATPSGFTGTQVLNDPKPNCDGNKYQWNNSTGAVPTCSSAGLVLTDTGNTLACLNAQDPATITTDGYAAFVVTPKSDYVALAFHQEQVITQITGEYFAIIPDQSGAYTTFEFYSVNADGAISKLYAQSALPQPVGRTFVVGVQYVNNSYTLYVNNQQVATTSDTSGPNAQGEFGMCTQGSATFSDAVVYKANT